MGDVNPATLRDVFIIMATLVVMITGIIRTINSAKSKPPTGESLASIASRLSAIDRDLEETKRRHDRHERKMGEQIRDIWKQYDTLLSAVAENGGIMKSFIIEMRNWRNSHDAQNNHS